MMSAQTLIEGTVIGYMHSLITLGFGLDDTTFDVVFVLCTAYIAVACVVHWGSKIHGEAGAPFATTIRETSGSQSYAFPPGLPQLYTFTEPFIFSQLRGRKRILDVGCGDGWLTQRLAQRVLPSEIVAIDICKEAIERAKKYHASPIIRYLAMDAEGDDLLNLGCFDAIFLRNTFHHFRDKEAFLMKVKMMLSPEGILLIVDLDRKANYCFLGVLATFLRSIQYNGLLSAASIAWSTKFFLQPDFRFHRKQDFHLLRSTSWLDYQSIYQKVKNILPGCKMGRIGSIAGFGGCYYILYRSSIPLKLSDNRRLSAECTRSSGDRAGSVPKTGEVSVPKPASETLARISVVGNTGVLPTPNKHRMKAQDIDQAKPSPAGQNSSDIVISVKSIHHWYLTKNGVEHIIDGLDLEIRRGEILAILGSSGLGKSTLIKICSGLLRPTMGEVLFYCGRGKRYPIAEAVMQHQVGILFQRPVLLPWKTVLENAVLPLQIIDPHYIAVRKVKELLSAVALDEQDLGKFPHQLSGGMQQRLALAMVLSYDPAVLFLDEPFGSLDAVTRRQMYNLVLSMWEQSRDRTIVFVTHDFHEAVFLADRALILAQKPIANTNVHILNIPIERPRSFDLIYESQFRELAEQAFAIMSLGGEKNASSRV
jgi:NitT/TauT family transport system ATP-binding protein